MKYILGIQTAERKNEIGLMKRRKTDKTDKIEAVKLEGKKATEQLASATEKLVKKAGIKVRDINLVSVCIGPGSYTGLRGGMAFAKGFCQFGKVGLVGVSGFEVLRGPELTNKFQGQSLEPTVEVLDAGHGRIFVEWEGKVQVMKVGKLTGVIKEKALFVGSGAVEYKDSIKKKLEDKCEFVEGKKNKLSAEAVASVGYEKWEKENSIVKKEDLYKLNPLYVLKPSIG